MISVCYFTCEGCGYRNRVSPKVFEALNWIYCIACDNPTDFTAPRTPMLKSTPPASPPVRPRKPAARVVPARGAVRASNLAKP